jgi:hypothetical protein
MSGEPIAALAKVVLASPGSLSAANMAVEGTVSKLDTPAFAERALVAGLPLATGNNVTNKLRLELDMAGKMMAVYDRMAPGVYRLARRVLPMLMKPAMHVKRVMGALMNRS